MPTELAQIPPALRQLVGAPPRCDYLIRGERLQERCACSAVAARNTGHGLFYYCETHHREAQERMKGKAAIFLLGR